MNHYIQYHNVEKMGVSASSLSEPKLHTDKSVRNLSSNVVWLISGEGGSPKKFYLAAVFKVNRLSAGTYDHPDFKNSAYGIGHIFGETILLNGLPWFEELKENFQNFRNGLTELTDSTKINELRSNAGTHAL
jgi:hypothetical protein